MKAPRVGFLCGSLQRFRTVTSPLGATTLAVSLALALVVASFAGPVSQAAPLRIERDTPVFDLSITLAPVNAAPPVPALQSPANGAWVTQSNVEFRWQDASAPTYNLRVDGVVYTTTATSMVLALSDGTHQWTAQAKSELGEASGYAPEWTVNVDTIPPPVPVLQSPADGSWTIQPNVEFSWQSLGGSSYNLRVDGIVYTTTATSMVQALADGAHAWTVRSRDWLGNASAYAPEWTVNVDTTPPPEPALQSPADDSWTNQSNVEFRWQSLGGSSYNLRVDGIVYTTTATSMVQALADGAHTWTVRSQDWLGNASAYAPEWTVNVDTTPPPVPALQSPADDSWTNQSNVEFRWQDLGVDSYNLRADGAVYTTTSPSMALALNDGAHTWTVRSRDWLGNPSAYAAEWTVNVDTTPPPVPALSAPVNGTVTRNSNLTFSWQNVSAHSYNLRVDGVVYTTTATSMMLPQPLGDGPHNWTVRSRDWLGNASAYAAGWTVTVDTTPPPVPVLIGPANGTATRDPSIRFDWSDVGASTYDFKVDGTVYSTSDTSMTRVLGEGPHTWTVRSLDALGNASAYASSWTVTVDTIPPSKPTLISPPDGAFSTSASVQFSWSNVGAGTVYNLRVDGTVYTTTATSMTRSLANGPHSWAVQAQDALGNASGYTDPRAVTVDTVLPSVTIVAPVNGAVLTTTHLYTVTIQGTASDVGTGLDRVEVNTGAGWNAASGTGNWTYAWSLPLRDNLPSTLQVRAFDRAANESALAQVVVTVDTIAPSSGIPIPDRSPWVTPTVVYDWPPSSDGAGIARYQIRIYNTHEFDAVYGSSSSQYTFTQATEESAGYYAQVRARDGRGNWGAWSALSVVVIPDLTLPTVRDPYILEDSPKLHAAGTTLYYTNTMLVPQLFEVRGYSEDAPSGVSRVCFTPAFGEQPTCDTAGFQPFQSGSPSYSVDRGTSAGGAIVATVYDHAGNTVKQTYIYELDRTPPDSSASSPAYATSSPIRVAWTADDVQSGVYSVDLWYKYEDTSTWTYAQTRLAGQDSFRFVPTDGPGTYYFAIRARDNLGNIEPAVTVADTQTLYDTDAPTSEVTWAPPYWNHLSAPITMTWVATPSLPGNPVTEVRLWYRFSPDDDNTGDWVSTTIVGAGTSGVFEFDPLEGDGIYDFETVARDASGKSEALPYNSGDKTTVYDTGIEAPVGLTCDPASWSRTNLFTVRWTNPTPVDLSRIAAAYYRVGAAPTGPLDGTRVPGDDLMQIGGIVLPGEGRHTVWVWLEDKAGNVGNAKARGAACRYDASIGAPSGLTATPSGWTVRDVFTVTWSNPGDLSGIAGAYWKLDSPPVESDDGEWVPGPGLDRISAIPVITEGSHVLYVWLRDWAGNIDLDERRTVSLQHDPTPPTDASITAPESTEKVRFEVYWAADAAASGVLRYTVEYSGAMDSAWQPWLPSTTETSGMFTAPVADAEYAFRVTVYDQALNSARAQTTTYVKPQHLYLPVLLERWRDWYRYDIYELNDTPPDAYGPLKMGQTYQSYIWNEEDPSDYYHFTPSSSRQIRISLTNIPDGRDYDLYVYYYQNGKYELGPYSNGSGSGPEIIDFSPIAGRKYYIRVYPFKGYSNTQPYHLAINYR
jgi:hypothetical protein